MPDDPLNDVLLTLQQIATDPDAPTHLRLGAANSMMQLARDSRGGQPEDVEPGALLTPTEVAALKDALPWCWDVQLLMPDQQAVLVKLGVYSRKELDAEIKAVLPRRRRR